MTANSDPPLLSDIARLFAQRAGQYCLAAAITGAMGVAALTALAMYMLGRFSVTLQDAALPSWASMDEGKKFSFVFGLTFAVWVPVLVGSRAACRITEAQIADQGISLGMIVADMLRVLPSTMVYAFAIGLPVMVGSTCFVIPGLLIASSFTLVVPVGVHEPAGIFSAIRRNFSLIGKVFGGSFLITILCAVALAMMFVLKIAGIDPLLNHFLLQSSAITLVLRVTIIYVPALLLLVLANIGFTLLYYNARGAEQPISLMPLLLRPHNLQENL